MGTEASSSVWRQEAARPTFGRGWVIRVQRKVPPPDFRYVWLMPGPASGAAAVGVGVVGIAAVGVGLWNGGHQPLALLLSLSASALAFLAFARSERGVPARPGAREVTMAIVPWGVVLTPDTEPRVLRWSAIRKVSVDVTHTLRGGTPSAVQSLVTVETPREVFAGRAPGSVELEGLMANLEAYADEASRPVACDLDGNEPADDGATEPLAALLLRHATDLCASSRGAAALALPPGGYRTVATPTAAPETIAKLRAILADAPEGAADPRPLAALVAGLLGARDLVPDLLRLASSPHPVVAAVAKASAIRLGAPRNRAGSIDEVAAFLFDEDARAFAGWAEPGSLA